MRTGFENTENLVFENLVARETLSPVLALPLSDKLNPNRSVIKETGGAVERLRPGSCRRGLSL